MLDTEYKEWLIGELAIAETKDDENRIIQLSCELYECFGWYGAGYFTH